MSLIDCPDCAAQISSLADACPRCGYPIAGGGTTQAHGGKIQTIEKTSKRYKLSQLVLLLFLLGCILVISKTNSEMKHALALFGLIIGIAIWIGLRFVVWWHHG